MNHLIDAAEEKTRLGEIKLTEFRITPCELPERTQTLSRSSFEHGQYWVLTNNTQQFLRIFTLKALFRPIYSMKGLTKLQHRYPDLKMYKMCGQKHQMYYGLNFVI